MSFLDATGMGQRPPCGICSVRSLNDLLRSISCYPARTRSSVQHSSVVLRRSEEHTSELQSHSDIVCRLLLEKKNIKHTAIPAEHTNTPRPPRNRAGATQ